MTEAPDDQLGPLRACRQYEAFGNSDAGRQRFLQDGLGGLSVRRDHAADEARRPLALAFEQEISMPCEQGASVFRAHERQERERSPTTLGVAVLEVLDEGGPCVLFIALGQAPTGQFEAAVKPKWRQRVERQRVDALRIFEERVGDGPIGEEIVHELDAIRRNLNQHAVRDQGGNGGRVLRCDVDESLAVAQALRHAQQHTSPRLGIAGRTAHDMGAGCPPVPGEFDLAQYLVGLECRTQQPLENEGISRQRFGGMIGL